MIRATKRASAGTKINLSVSCETKSVINSDNIYHICYPDKSIVYSPRIKDENLKNKILNGITYLNNIKINLCASLTIGVCTQLTPKKSRKRRAHGPVYNYYYCFLFLRKQFQIYNVVCCCLQIR